MQKNRRLTHGTLSGYKEYNCRCRKCRDVWDVYMQSYREDIFDELRAKKKPVEIELTPRDYAEYVDSDWEES